MNNVPWLSVLWLVPLAGAVLIILLPPGRRRLAKWAGMVVSVLTLAVSIVVAAEFKPSAEPYQFVEKHSWIPAFGAGYTLGVDGIAVVLVLLTTVLIPLLLVAGWNDATDADDLSPASGRYPQRPAPPRLRSSGGERTRGVHAYVALTLAIESMVLMSVIALDVLLFYVFFEAMLIPMYFLIGGFGQGAGRSRAAVKFLLYNLFGGLIMLAAVIGLYVVTAQYDSGTFDFREIVAGVAAGRYGADPAVFKALFLGFMFAFAIKAPLWPFHRWLPDAAVESTPATAVLMMAVMDKVGTFGMLRYCLQLFPDPSTYFRPLIVTLAIIGVIYGAIVAIGQTDMMRLIAYTSISHFGFIIAGIFVMTTQGQSGSTLYMLNHGLSTAAVFLIAGFLIGAARQPIDRRLRRCPEGGAHPGRHVHGLGHGHRIAARPSPVYQRIPGSAGHFQPLLAGGGVRRYRTGPLGRLHAVALPAGDDRSGSRRQRTHRGSGGPRDDRGGTVDRAVTRAWGLPQTCARHHKSGGREHHDHHRPA